MRRFFGALVWIGVLASSALALAGPATQPTTSATQPDANVERLLLQLSADDWKVRQRAEEQLIALGPSIVPQLQAAAAHGVSAEAQARLESILAAIEENEILSPTRVTLQYKDTSADTVIAELARQSRVPVTFWPEQDRQGFKAISVDLVRQPFWVAMLEICAQAELTVMEGDSTVTGIRVVRSGQSGRSPFTSAHEGFLFVAHGISRTHTVDFMNRGAAANTYANLTVAVWIDPKLQVVRYSGSPAIEQLVDEKGQSLQSDAMRGSGFNDNTYNSTRRRLDLSIPLKYPKEPGQKIARLKGSFQVVVPVKFATAEIDKPLEAGQVSKQVGDFQFGIRSLKRDGPGSYSFTFDTKAPSDRLGFLRRGDNPYAPVLFMYFLDAEGRVFYQQALRGGGMGGSVSGGQGELAKILLKSPTEMKMLTVPIELKDMPLP